MTLALAWFKIFIQCFYDDRLILFLAHCSTHKALSASVISFSITSKLEKSKMAMINSHFNLIENLMTEMFRTLLVSSEPDKLALL